MLLVLHERQGRTISVYCNICIVIIFATSICNTN